MEGSSFSRSVTSFPSNFGFINSLFRVGSTLVISSSSPWLHKFNLGRDPNPLCFISFKFKILCMPQDFEQSLFLITSIALLLFAAIHLVILRCRRICCCCCCCRPLPLPSLLCFMPTSRHFLRRHAGHFFLVATVTSQRERPPLEQAPPSAAWLPFSTALGTGKTRICRNLQKSLFRKA